MSSLRKTITAQPQQTDPLSEVPVANQTFTVGTPASVPMTANSGFGLPFFSEGTALPSGVTISGANLNWSGTGTPGTTTGHIVRASATATSADADWFARSTGPGVLWAHDFRESNAELENFVRLGNQTNPNPATLPNPLTLVTSPMGSSRAIRSRAAGARITSDIPQVAKGASQSFTVTDATRFPNPAVIGPYSLYIGSVGGTDTNPTVFEECTVTAINTGTNTLTVTRTSASSTIRVNGVSYASTSTVAPAIPGTSNDFTIGYTNSGSWNRPFGCFPQGQNGKATADQGILNGAARKTRTWDATRGGNGHRYFREGYFGSRWYWDPAVNPAAPYKDFTPLETGDGQGFPHIDAFEGDEFYLQFRFKVSRARLQATRAKLAYIQYAAQSGPGQLFWDVGVKRFNVQPPPGEKLAGREWGTPMLTYAGGADSRQPAGGYFGSDLQTDSFDMGATPWHQAYPSGIYSKRNDADCYAFCPQEDQWVTLLTRMRLGRDNGEQYFPTGVGSATPQPPWPAASDPSFRTIVETKVHVTGWADYKTLVSVDDAAWFHGDNLGAIGWLRYNAPGLNCFWMTQEFNMYVGAGSVAPPDGYADAEFTQAILSRNPIPVPNDAI